MVGAVLLDVANEDGAPLQLRRLLLAFGVRWAVCFGVAAGIAACSVSSVQLMLLVFRLIAAFFGLAGFDESMHRFC